MDDPGTQDPVNAGQILAAMVQDRVDQGAGGMARSRMDHHLLWFVYDQKIFILIEDIKGNILGKDIKNLRLREFHLDAVMQKKPVIGFYRLVGNSDHMVPDHLLDL